MPPLREARNSHRPLTLGVQVADVLRQAGFKNVEFQPFGSNWYELAVAGPMEFRSAEEAITNALLKKIVITVGERRIGALLRIKMD